jgi:hypothetical protein
MRCESSFNTTTPRAVLLPKACRIHSAAAAAAAKGKATWKGTHYTRISRYNSFGKIYEMIHLATHHMSLNNNFISMSLSSYNLS